MNFIVLCEGRCGSEMIVSYINMYKNLFCYGELLNLNINRITAQISKDILETAKKKIKNKKIGFKLKFDELSKIKKNIDNYNNLWNYFKENNTKIIFLYRKNIFLRNLSLFKAEQHNVWHFSSNNILKYNKPIYFDLLRHEQEKNIILNARIEYKKLISDLKLSSIDICYENILNNSNHKNELIVFLNEKYKKNIDFSNLKVIKPTPYPLHKQIINFQDIEKNLKHDSDFNEALSFK